MYTFAKFLREHLSQIFLVCHICVIVSRRRDSALSDNNADLPQVEDIPHSPGLVSSQICMSGILHSAHPATGSTGRRGRYPATSGTWWGSCSPRSRAAPPGCGTSWVSHPTCCPRSSSGSRPGHSSTAGQPRHDWDGWVIRNNIVNQG